MASSNSARKRATQARGGFKALWHYIAGALRDLCARAYLQALPCPGDDRKKRLALTPKALALHRQVQQTAAALERQLCHGLTPGQQDAAEHTLRRMLQNLGGA